MKIPRFLPPAPVFEDEDKTLAAHLTHVILMALLMITVVTSLTPLFVRDIVLSTEMLYLVLSVSLGAIVGMKFLLQRGYVKLTNWILVSLFWLMITVLVFSTGGVHSQAFFGYFAVVALAGLLLGGRVSTGVTILSVVSGLVTIYVGEKSLFPAAAMIPPSRIIWFSASAYLVILAILQNLATRTIRNTLNRARRSEHHYRLLFEESPDGICITDSNNQIVMMNGALHHLLGYSLDEAKNKEPVNFIAPEDLLKRKARPLDALRASGTFQTERVLVHKDGTRIPVIITGKHMPDQRFQYIIRDVTERKNMEQALLQKEETTREFLEKLKNLHEISIELSKATSLDELYRHTIELGCARLGFDRMGFFLFEGDASVGTYGTDTEGSTQPEHHLRLKLEDTPKFQSLLLEQERVRVWENVPLTHNLKQAGFGWNAIVGMWDGDQPLGFLAIDNLIHHQIYQPYQGELLKLLGIAIGHLLTRKRAEEAILESEALYRKAIEAADAVPYYQDYGPEAYEKPYTFMGEGIRDLTGYGPDEMSAERWDSLVEETVLRGKGARFSHEEAVLRARAGEIPIWQCDYRIRTRDGELRWIADTAVEILNEQGVSTGSIGIMQDVTDRKQVAERIEREHHLLRMIIDNLPDYIYLKDTDQRCLVSNVANAHVLGTTPEAIIGKTLGDFYPPEEAEKYDAQDREIIATGRPITNRENTFFDADTDQQRWALMSRIPFRAPDGTITGIIGISHDITDRKLAELALAEQAEETAMLYQVSGKLARLNEYLEGLAEQIVRIAIHDLGMPDCGVWLSDEDSRQYRLVAYEGYSENMPGMVSLDRPGLITTAIHTQEPVYVPDVRLDPRYLLGEPTTLSEFVIPLKVQERVIGIVNVESPEVDAISPKQQRVMLAFAERAALALENARLVESLEVAVDEVQQLNAILEQRVAERTEALEQRTQELEAANKELETFSYSVSHDLRAPLRAIDGFSSILIESYAGQMHDDAQHFLHRVREGAQRMNQLVNDLLAFSRINRKDLNKRQISLASLVHEVLEELESEQVGRNIELIIGDLPDCHADPSLLRQVYANLIGNALKFTRKTPQARIEIGARSGRGARIERGTQSEHGETIYFVSDNGAGFDMQFADKLFGVFQRLHTAEQFEGTGIGLANVKRIITRHGGRIWADAAPNQGAAFYFTLPAND